MNLLYDKNKDEQKSFSRKENKNVLDREEKKLGKIADKNTTIRGVKTKALKRFN